MQLVTLFVTLALMVGLQTADSRNQPPTAIDDDVFLLYHPVQVIDIPVLDNDVDPEGQTLRVTRLGLAEGGKAEIVAGKAVRVHMDWSSASGGMQYGLAAHGVYYVSDGLAGSKAEWRVWYWPEILP